MSVLMAKKRAKFAAAAKAEAKTESTEAEVKIPGDWETFTKTKLLNLAKKLDESFAGDEAAAKELIAQAVVARAG